MAEKHVAANNPGVRLSCGCVYHGPSGTYIRRCLEHRSAACARLSTAVDQAVAAAKPVFEQDSLAMTGGAPSTLTDYIVKADEWVALLDAARTVCDAGS